MDDKVLNDKPITQSILLTIKKMLGIAEEYHAFDLDIITNINSVFLVLNQLGVGPRLPYAITGTKEIWADFLGEQEEYLAGVQTYMYQKARLYFDPPTNSFLVDAMQKSCQEFEWRFMVQPKSEAKLEYVESFAPTIQNQNGSNEAPIEPDVPDETTTTTTVMYSKRTKSKDPFDIFS